MPYLTDLTHKIARSEGDPKIVSTGPGSLSPFDRLGKALGWLSFGLGAAELAAPGTIARALGMQDGKMLLRAYGAREIAAGFLCLSAGKQAGLWSRVAGDGVDIVTLLPTLRNGNAKRDNAMLALGIVAAITALDLVAAAASANRHRRTRGRQRRYGDRSGYPHGIESARGAAQEAALSFRHHPVPALSYETPVQGRA